MFAQQLFGRPGAFAALGGDTEFAAQTADTAGAIIDGLPDLGIGDAVTKANVHASRSMNNAKNRTGQYMRMRMIVNYIPVFNLWNLWRA